MPQRAANGTRCASSFSRSSVDHPTPLRGFEPPFDVAPIQQTSPPGCTDAGRRPEKLFCKLLIYIALWKVNRNWPKCERPLLKK